MTIRGRRRGAMMVMAVVVMGLVAGLLSLLALTGAHRYRDRQIERVRQVARAVGDSASAYARMHSDGWLANPPAEPVELDVTGLLPTGLTGDARVAFVKTDSGASCRVAARVGRGAHLVVDEFEVELK